MQQGFTLLELMVVISIVAISFGLGLTSLITFQARQQAEVAGLQVREVFLEAKNRAAIGQKSGSCLNTQTLDGWQVVLLSAQEVAIQAICSGSAQANDFYQVVAGSVISFDSPVFFESLTNRVSDPGDVMVSTSNLDYVFSISNTGSVSTGGLQ